MKARWMSARDKHVIKEMTEIRDLLAEFGLALSGYDPGITAMFKDRPSPVGDGWGGEPITLDREEWRWLRPLLEELRSRRKTSEVPIPASPKGTPR
jgi:hypothetical protein